MSSLVTLFSSQVSNPSAEGILIIVLLKEISEQGNITPMFETSFLSSAKILHVLVSTWLFSRSRLIDHLTDGHVDNVSFWASDWVAVDLNHTNLSKSDGSSMLCSKFYFSVSNDLINFMLHPSSTINWTRVCFMFAGWYFAYYWYWKSVQDLPHSTSASLDVIKNIIPRTLNVSFVDCLPILILTLLNNHRWLSFFILLWNNQPMILRKRGLDKHFLQKVHNVGPSLSNNFLIDGTTLDNIKKPPSPLSK